jgi:hypothetical protein
VDGLRGTFLIAAPNPAKTHNTHEIAQTVLSVVKTIVLDLVLVRATVGAQDRALIMSSAFSSILDMGEERLRHYPTGLMPARVVW